LANAYLLFYERKKYYNEEMEEVYELYDGLKDVEPSIQRKMSVMEYSENQILQNVASENIQYFRKLYFFESNT